MAIETTTFHGSPLGINLQKSSHELDPNQARWVQDYLLDEEGIVRMRGPVKTATGVMASIGDNLKPFGVVGTFDLDGVYRVAVLAHDDGSNAYLRVLTTDYSAVAGDYSWPLLWNLADPYPLVDAKPSIGPGTLIGVSSKYGFETPPKRMLGLWRGASKPNYSTGTITATLGSQTVTGSGTTWSTNVSNGMFLFSGTGGSYTLLGVVKSVNSNTSITLEKGALNTIAAGGSHILMSVRGLVKRYGRGRITVSSGATVVNGGDTKFLDAGISSSYNLFRASDYTYIGSVTSVQSNIQLTLTAGATQTLTNDRYVLIPTNQDYSSGTVNYGVLHAVWNGYQFYGNHNAIAANGTNMVSRVFFAEQHDMEAIDTSPTEGNFFDIPSTKASATEITGLVATNNALVVLKEDETYGVFGSSQDNWSVKKISDDGCLSNMTAWSFEGNAVWAGKRGIYVYDGILARNVLEDTLGDFYQKTVASFDHSTKRMWGMISNEHYFLFIEAATPPRGYIKGNTTITPTRMTFVVNLRTMAAIFVTNVEPRGAVITPSRVGKGTLYVVNNATALANAVAVASADDIFKSTGRDVVKSKDAALGPVPVFEWLKFDVEDPQRKKLFKQLQLHHKTDAPVALDVIPGMNDFASTAASTFGPSPNSGADWQNKRIKFLKRSQLLSFRLYPLETFGFTGSAGINAAGGSNLLVATLLVLPAGAIKSIWGTINNTGGSNDSGSGGLYNPNGTNGLPGTLVAQTLSNAAINPGTGNEEFVFNTPYVLSQATSLWVSIQWGATSGGFKHIRGNNNGLGTLAVANDTYDGTLPDPWATNLPLDSETSTQQVSIWVEYIQPTFIKFGPWAVGYKQQRIGRV